MFTGSKAKRVLFQLIPYSKVKDWRVHEGFDFITILADGRAFRFPKNNESAQKIKIEKKLLNYLRGKMDLLVPNYQKQVKYGPDNYIEIVGQEFTPCFYRKLSHKQKTEICRKLARFIKKIHSITLPKSLAAQMSIDNWSKILRQLKKDISHYFESESFFEEFLLLFTKFTNEKRNSCLVHGDLSGDNIIVDYNKKKLVGVIDFGDVRFSDPAVDFAQFWEFGEKFVTDIVGFYTKDCQARTKILEASNLYYCYIMLSMMIIKKKIS